MNIGERIRKMRESLSLSQQDLALKIGLPRPALSQIESGGRKVSADELLLFSKALNMTIDQLMGLSPVPSVSIASPSRENRATPHPQEMRISVPQKKMQKFRQVILYLLDKVGAKPNIGETVLYKLLYFIDFNYYEQYEEQLIGATYIKNHYGPTPVEFKKLIDQMVKDKEIEQVKSRYFNFPQTKYLPRLSPDLSLFSAREKEEIDRVIERLSDMNAAQISAYSHKDVPWITTEKGQPIDYESVFYRTPDYSMRPAIEDI